MPPTLLSVAGPVEVLVLLAPVARVAQVKFVWSLCMACITAEVLCASAAVRFMSHCLLRSGHLEGCWGHDIVILITQHGSTPPNDDT